MVPGQANNPLLATESLTKDYGRFRALDTLTLRISPGEVYGLLGPNGSGKSTALRILLGFLRPTSGMASIGGHDCWTDSVAARRLVTYLPGELRLYENMTGRQIVNFLARLRGASVDGEVDVLAKRFDIDLTRPLVQLSSGMKRKVALLAVLAPRVPLVILDEPTNTLDPTMRDELLGQFRAASERGQTVLFSSHVLAEVERVCDRVGILQRGKLVHEQTIAELQKASLIRARFSRGCRPIGRTSRDCKPSKRRRLSRWLRTAGRPDRCSNGSANRKSPRCAWSRSAWPAFIRNTTEPRHESTRAEIAPRLALAAAGRRATAGRLSVPLGQDRAADSDADRAFFFHAGQSRRSSQKAIEDVIFGGPGKLAQSVIGGESIHFERAMDTLSIGYVHPLMQIIFGLWAIGRAAGASPARSIAAPWSCSSLNRSRSWKVVAAHLAVDALVIPILCLSLWSGTLLGVQIVGPFQVTDADLAAFKSLPFKIVVAPELLDIDPMAFGPAIVNVAATVVFTERFDDGALRRRPIPQSRHRRRCSHGPDHVSD